MSTWKAVQYHSPVGKCQLKPQCGAAEMTQQVIALAAPSEDLSVVPSTHMEAHNCL